jgi:cytidine deaminase
VSPCGACRQVLAEFSSPPEATMITFLRQGTFQTVALSDLLPDQFALDATPPPRDRTAPT